MRSPAEAVARVIGVGALTLALLAAVITARRGGDGPRESTSTLEITAKDRDADSSIASAVRENILHTAARDAVQRPEQDATRRSGEGSASQASSSTMRLHVTSVPAASVRAVLGAAARAGVTTVWDNATGARSLAVSASRVPSPANATAITYASTMAPAPATPSVVLRDAGGVLDSMAVAGSTAARLRLRVARLQSPLLAQLVRGGEIVAQAEAGIPDLLMMRRVRLYAAPGWESKFVVAALEESGWSVDGAYQIAPTATVRFGAPSTLDTSRYAAAIVLDSGLVSVRGLRAFLAQGGGVVIAGNALRDPTLLALAAARIQDDRAVIAGALLTDQPRLGIPAAHLAVAPEATVLEREARATVVSVMRRDVGRVMLNGYRDTWRWRMEGNDEGAAAHRAWWNGLVSAVAFVSVAPRGSATSTTSPPGASAFWPGDEAPLADLVARLGAPESLPFVRTSPTMRLGWSFPSWLLFAIAAVALVGEWALRRLRGAA